MFNIKHFETLTSTNDYCKDNINILNHYDVVIADEQSHGRGRKDHQWIASKGKNLLCSIVLKEDLDIKTLHQLASVAALSVIETLPVSARVKFPNDIFVNGLKISGILIESVISTKLEGIIVGIGINVNETNLPVTGTSLVNEGIIINVLDVLDQLLNRFNVNYNLYKNNQYSTILDKVNKYSYLKNKRVTLPNERVIKVLNLLENGQIEIEENNEINHIFINDFSMSKI